MYWYFNQSLTGKKRTTVFDNGYRKRETRGFHMTNRYEKWCTGSSLLFSSHLLQMWDDSKEEHKRVVVKSEATQHQTTHTHQTTQHLAPQHMASVSCQQHHTATCSCCAYLHHHAWLREKYTCTLYAINFEGQ